jgi:hypothetical protein
MNLENCFFKSNAMSRRDWRSVDQTEEADGSEILTECAACSIACLRC